MHGADARPGARERSLNLHQATGIERDHGVRAGAQDGFDLGARHGARDVRRTSRRKCRRSRSTLRPGRISRSSRPRTLASRRRGRVLDAQFAQGVAAIVKRDHVFHARAHVFHAAPPAVRNVENSQTVLLDRVDARQRLRLLVEEFREMMRDHGGAGAGRHHDALARCRTYLQEVARHGAGFRAIAAVEGGLPAAGLVFRKIDLAAERAPARRPWPSRPSEKAGRRCR